MLEAILGVVLTLIHIGVIFYVLVVERRQPSATLAWLLALIFLPGLGLVFYFLFGTTRARRVAKRYARAAEELRGILSRHEVEARLLESQDGSIRERAAGLLQLGQRVATTPPSAGNRCDMLVDGRAAYDAMVAAAEDARDHIHVQFFIVQPDDTGRSMRDFLAERARAGLTVRVLTDGVGTRVPPRFWRPLIEAGGHVAVFSPVWKMFGRIRRADRIDFRNHRKLVIVDGQGRLHRRTSTSADEYLGLDQGDAGIGAIRFMRIEGPGGAEPPEAAFAEDWFTASGELIDAPQATSPIPTGNVDGPFAYPHRRLGPGPAASRRSRTCFMQLAFASAQRAHLDQRVPTSCPDPSIKEAPHLRRAARGRRPPARARPKPDHKTVVLARRASPTSPTLLEGRRKRHPPLRARASCTPRRWSWMNGSATIGSANHGHAFLPSQLGTQRVRIRKGRSRKAAGGGSSKSDLDGTPRMAHCTKSDKALPFENQASLQRGSAAAVATDVMRGHVHASSQRTAAGEVSALLLRPDDATCTLVLLAHGAGAGMRHRVRCRIIAEALASARHRDVPLQLPVHAEAEGRRPAQPPADPARGDRALRRGGRRGARRQDLPLFAGGKSMGGRMSSRSPAAKEPLPGVRGPRVLRLPAASRRQARHRAGRPPRRRRAPDAVPAGHPRQAGRTSTCSRPSSRAWRPATLHVVDGADHGFFVLKRSGRTPAEVLAELARTTPRFCASVSTMRCRKPWRGPG